MKAEIELDLKNTPKVFIKTTSGQELFIHETSTGELRVSTDGANLLILPRGSNCFNIEFRK